LIVRAVGTHEIELRLVPFEDVALYARLGWMFVVNDPADEDHLAAWVLFHGVVK